MKFYHKIFKNNPDLSTYLENVETLVAYGEVMLNRLTQAKDMDELYEAMCLILEKFTFLFKY